MVDNVESSDTAQNPINPTNEKNDPKFILTFSQFAINVEKIKHDVFFAMECSYGPDEKPNKNNIFVPITRLIIKETNFKDKTSNMDLFRSYKYIIFIELTGENVRTNNISRLLKSNIESSYKNTISNTNKSLSSIKENFEKIPSYIKKELEDLRRNSTILKNLDNSSYENIIIFRDTLIQMLIKYKENVSGHIDSTNLQMTNETDQLIKNGQEILVGEININKHGKSINQIPYLFKLYDIPFVNVDGQNGQKSNIDNIDLCNINENGLSNLKQITKITIHNNFHECDRNTNDTKCSNELIVNLCYKDGTEDKKININDVLFIDYKYVQNECVKINAEKIHAREHNFAAQKKDSIRQKIVSGGYTDEYDNDDDGLSATSAFDDVDMTFTKNKDMNFSSTGSDKNIFQSQQNKLSGGYINENIQYSPTSSISNTHKNQYGGINLSETSQYDGSIHISQLSDTSGTIKYNNQYGGNNLGDNSQYDIHMSQLSDTSNTEKYGTDQYCDKNKLCDNNLSETSQNNGMIHISQYSDTSKTNHNDNKYGFGDNNISDTSQFNDSIHVSQLSDTSNDMNYYDNKKSMSPFMTYNMMPNNMQKNTKKYNLSDSNIMSFSQNSNTSVCNNNDNLFLKQEYDMNDLLRFSNIHNM